MGILGLGRIGKADRPARRGVRPRASPITAASKQDGVAYPYYPTLLALAEACDILVIAAPGGA